MPCSGGNISPSNTTSALAGIGKSVTTTLVTSTGALRIHPANPYSDTPQLRFVPAASKSAGSWPRETATAQDFPFGQYSLGTTSPLYPDLISATNVLSSSTQKPYDSI